MCFIITRKRLGQLDFAGFAINYTPIALPHTCSCSNKDCLSERTMPCGVFSVVASVDVEPRWSAPGEVSLEEAVEKQTNILTNGGTLE